MIKEKLDQKQQKELKTLDEASALTDFKLLMDEDSMNDLHILQQAFPSSINNEVINKNGEKKHINELKEKHKGDIYTLKEIKNLCFKYRLRFLPSSYFKGSVPIELIHTIKEKCTKENNLSHLEKASFSTYKENLFILAPSSMFEIRSLSKLKKDELNEIKRIKKADPAAFIKITDDEYLFLKEWGNSFSPFRRVLGALTAKNKTLNKLFFLAWFVYTSILIYGGVEFIKNSANKNGYIINSPFLIFGIILLVWTGVSSISWPMCSLNGFFLAKFKDSSKDFWKVDSRYATENNWDSSY